MAVIDLNADLGESFGSWRMGDDDTMLDIVSSANIACGFHAGDPLILRKTCAKAVEKGVAIGAHISYRDLAGFGRRFMDIALDELEADLLYQLGAISAMARIAGGKVSYVKPHGALYNAIVHHEAQADAVVRAIKTFDETLPIMCLPRSLVLQKAEAAGMRPIAEAFSDRAYTDEGTLVSRRLPNAVLHDPEDVAQRMVRLATEGLVTSASGADVQVSAQSICTHGDSPGAVSMARAVKEALIASGVTIQAFT